jgi:hypothetical protein
MFALRALGVGAIVLVFLESLREAQEARRYAEFEAGILDEDHKRLYFENQELRDRLAKYEPEEVEPS